MGRENLLPVAEVQLGGTLVHGFRSGDREFDLDATKPGRNY